MGKHSIRFKITLLFAGIICILIVMLLLFNITFSEKFYMKDKQEAMLNAYESIDDASTSTVQAPWLTQTLRIILSRYRLPKVCQS